MARMIQGACLELKEEAESREDAMNTELQSNRQDMQQARIAAEESDATR